MKSLRFRLLTASLSLTASILLATPAMADSLTGRHLGTLTSLNTITLPVGSPFHLTGRRWPRSRIHWCYL